MQYIIAVITMSPFVRTILICCVKYVVLTCNISILIGHWSDP